MIFPLSLNVTARGFSNQLISNSILAFEGNRSRNLSSKLDNIMIKHMGGNIPTMQIPITKIDNYSRFKEW